MYLHVYIISSYQTDTKVEIQEKPSILWRFLSSAELPFFLYVFGLMMHMPILQQYAYLRFSIQDNFPYHFSAHQSSCGDALNKTLKVLQEKVCLYFRCTNLSPFTFNRAYNLFLIPYKAYEAENGIVMENCQ